MSMLYKHHVFISHITEEKETAICLKEYLRETLGWGTKVFVSSDLESIQGGDIWFKKIVDAIRGSMVEIVLLSPTSNDRKWINFEAGVGVGKGIQVIPVVVHGLQRSDVGHPLSSLQIRSLDDEENVRALLRDVGKAIGQPLRVIHMERFLREINEGSNWQVSQWRGTEWQGTFLAVEGPVLKLAEQKPQTYQESMGKALTQAGFKTYLASRSNLGPTLSKGYKVVYMTDRKSYRMEIESFDVVLTAKPIESPTN
jgi:hypothetical protein